MSILLTLARVYIPDILKKRIIRELFELTARSFQCDTPQIRGVSYKELLSAYARFTQTKAEAALRDQTDMPAIKRRMYESAFQLGQAMRRWFRIRTIDDVIKASKILYSILGIEYSGNPDGSVRITRCFFSEFYSSDICRLISSLDEGAAAGLSGGGSLVFYERLTEGNDCCKAVLSFTGTRS